MYVPVQLQMCELHNIFQDALALLVRKEQMVTQVKGEKLDSLVQQAQLAQQDLRGLRDLLEIEESVVRLGHLVLTELPVLKASVARMVKLVQLAQRVLKGHVVR